MTEVVQTICCVGNADIYLTICEGVGPDKLPYLSHGYSNLTPISRDILQCSEL